MFQSLNQQVFFTIFRISRLGSNLSLLTSASRQIFEPRVKPHHLYEENKTEVSINGLIRLGDFKEAVAENRMNYTEDDLLYHGVPNFLAPGSNFTDDQLFIPRQESVFNPVFPRCPERHWFNSILLMCYMMLVAVLLINLLVAMFATTYNKVRMRTLPQGKQ